MKLSLRKTNILKSIIILLIAIFLQFIVNPGSFAAITTKDLPSKLNIPFKLGLDLEGGTHLVYEANLKDIPADKQELAVEGVRDVIERRVNAFGIAEPLIQVNKTGEAWRIIVELAGVKDVNEAIEMIGQTPLLEFKELKSQEEMQLSEQQITELENYNLNAKVLSDEILSKAKENKDNFAKIGEEYSNKKDADIIYKNLSFINSKTNAVIYASSQGTETGNIVDGVIFDQISYNIVKINEKRETGKEIHANHILICYKDAPGCGTDLPKEQAKQKLEEIKLTITPENFGEMAAKNSDDPGTKNENGDLGWFGPDVMVKEFNDAAFALENNKISDIVETQFGYHLIFKQEERPLQEISVEIIKIRTKTQNDYVTPFDMYKNTELSGKHLKRAHVEFNDLTGEPVVALEFNDEGKEIFAAVTERNVGKGLAIFLDGKSIIDSNGNGEIEEYEIYNPTVNEAITEGKAEIVGVGDLETAKTITTRLNSGALPVPINLISQQTVGASLGHESLNLSMIAGIWGIIFVMIFMILYYRLLGVTSAISLLIYCVLLMLLFKIIPVTLTLSGIAGFILSVGMAVDANVLIFERIREELLLKKTLYAAINDGFHRAWPSIRDGNLSTLITCFILTWFGTSMIKGFAITLSLGIICSMFSAIVLTKIFLYAFSPQNVEKYRALFIRKY